MVRHETESSHRVFSQLNETRITRKKISLSFDRYYRLILIIIVVSSLRGKVVARYFTRGTYLLSRKLQISFAYIHFRINLLYFVVYYRD